MNTPLFFAPVVAPARRFALFPAACLLALLTACSDRPGDRVRDTCRQMLAMAQTRTDTLFVYAAEPSRNYPSCGYGFTQGAIQ